GVFRSPDGDKPYNDMEFYLVVRGNDWANEKVYGRRLHRLAKTLSHEAGVEVEFKIISRATLQHAPVSMFYYDLVSAHRWVLGDESLLAGAEHHRHGRDISQSEATRLLMNRCTGLLFAKEKLERSRMSDEDADFIFRNISKARLALGDAVLTMFRQYHWSCLVRNRRLNDLEIDENLPWLSEVRRQHELGVHFKLHPTPPPARSVLQSEFDKTSALAQQVWLWLENRRLDCHFLSMRGYALSSLNKCPETDPDRNRLINARIFGFHTYIQTTSEHHPRERVLNALAILLWLPWQEKIDLRRHLEKQLRHDMSVTEAAWFALTHAPKVLSAIPRVGKYFKAFQFPAPRFNFTEAYRNLWAQVR
ncbi:MAG TPA: hypothetical protein VN625_08750, partial [Desulfuromonadaceae bacterium]|nr:hypothetical protein [Desulfuromonadaceae bacterium]